MAAIDTLSPEQAAVDPNKALASATDILSARKEKFFWQVQNDLLDSVDSTALVDTAKASVQGGLERQQARTRRSLARFGVAVTPSQAKEANRLAVLQSSATNAGVVNNARIAQTARNDQAKAQLFNDSLALTQQSVDQLSRASRLATQRETNYQQRRAKYKAGKSATLGSLGSLALTVMAL